MKSWNYPVFNSLDRSKEAFCIFPSFILVSPSGPETRLTYGEDLGVICFCYRGKIMPEIMVSIQLTGCHVYRGIVTKRLPRIFWAKMRFCSAKHHAFLQVYYICM